MENVLRNIKELLEDAEVAVEELEKDFPDEEYDPYEWSGGNFDDAYTLGVEHGEVTAELQVLRRVVAIIEGGKSDV